MEPKRHTISSTVHVRRVREVSESGVAELDDLSTLSVKHGAIETEFEDLLIFNRSIFRETNHDELKRLLLQCLIMLSPVQRYGFNAMTFEEIFEAVKKKAIGEMMYVDHRTGKVLKEGKE